VAGCGPQCPYCLDELCDVTELCAHVECEHPFEYKVGITSPAPLSRCTVSAGDARRVWNPREPPPAGFNTNALVDQSAVSLSRSLIRTDAAAAPHQLKREAGGGVVFHQEHGRRNPGYSEGALLREMKRALHGSSSGGGGGGSSHAHAAAASKQRQLSTLLDLGLRPEELDDDDDDDLPIMALLKGAVEPRCTVLLAAPLPSYPP
jgi:hypothetical protein